ncbi:MAG TPA: Gldg family protein [Anaerolineae bacterium]|nr:Gldg family protein [Anaerolineae bacterium]
MKQIWAVARKELSAYFGSPLALIFVGAFLVVTLLVFFWVDAFFSRGIADIRPLFRWMPLLLLFLVAALTMRQWSEEQRSGTLEVLLTLPVSRLHLVLGKFLAVMILVALALALTLFLPLTVEVLGPLDWGPVVGGYLAALLLAAAYAAIGLFVSSRTDNQIVSLILTLALCGLFYLLGTDAVANALGRTVGDILRAVGTGSRFQSIQRGVIDLRDLVYYLSLTALFLTLNILSLDARRWSKGVQTATYRRHRLLTVALVAANLIALNAWLYPLGTLRADLTADRLYSLSPATQDLVSTLQEPLLIRGYFSAKTHPLLEPLVPTIRDVLDEYRIASRGKVEIEMVDPQQDAEAEAEANDVYGIRPTPFSVQGRYEQSVVNSYFDILVSYGDQNTTLGYQDLIQIEQSPTGQAEVSLRNLEYDLTRSIKKTVYGFQDLDSAFASIEGPVRLTAIITPNSLPSGLEEVPGTVRKVAADLADQSAGKFVFEEVDPDAPGATMTRQDLVNTYGLRPISAGIFSPDTYYMDLLLQIGDQVQVLYPSGALTEADIRSEMESAVKRAAPGFLKTVGLWLPDLEQVMNPYYGTAQDPLSSWNLLREQLSQNYTVTDVDLSSGRVPGNVDVLVVVSPQDMTDREQYAVDQFLMRGGAVVTTAGAYALDQGQFYGGITMQLLSGTLADLLKSYGVEVGASMVLDTQNEPFPMQQTRTVGGVQVTEYQNVSYPYFVDVRTGALSRESPITAGLPAVSLQWSSPITVTEQPDAGREVIVLAASTDESWLGTDANVTPDTETYPDFGFALGSPQQSHTLALALRGSFQSYFRDKSSPFEPAAGIAPTQTLTSTVGTVESSPATARLVVIGSNEFVDDVVLQLSQSTSGDRYLYSLQLMQNAVDWAVEDEDLLTIRSRGTYSRLLNTATSGSESFWEGLNYSLALLSLIAISIVWTMRRRGEQPMPLTDEGTAEPGPEPGEEEA